MPETINLSTHQKRVLVALLALEKTHGVRWWSRDQIGSVVMAGGYHAIIQRRTIARLKELELLQTERSSWPAAVQELVRCSCGAATWGLTELGRATIEELHIRLGEDARERIACCSYIPVLRDACGTWDDSEDPRRRFFLDHDDEDDE